MAGALSAAPGVLLFGGIDSNGGPLLTDTWLFDGASRLWSQLNPTVSPPARIAPSMAWDGTGFLLHGGQTVLGPSLADTWRFDLANNTWTQLASGPSQRTESGLVSLEVVPLAGMTGCLLFGGRDFNVDAGDTWSWNGTNWTQLTPANSPAPRSGHFMAYDPLRQRVVLYGGWSGGFNMFSDTWEFDGTNWAQVPGASQPGPRRLGRAIFDPDFGTVVLYGGLVGSDQTGTPLNDTWQLVNGSWVQIPTAAATTPVASRRLGMVWDVRAASPVLFGGRTGASFFAATDQTRRLLQAKLTPFATGCAGQQSNPRLQALTIPTTGTTTPVAINATSGTAVVVFVGDGLVPGGFSLANLGLPSCFGHFTNLIAEFALGLTGGSATMQLAIPAGTTFLGFEFFMQAALIDGSGNVSSISDAMVGVIR